VLVDLGERAGTWAFAAALGVHPLDDGGRK